MKPSLAYKFTLVAVVLIVVPMGLAYLLIRQQVSASLSRQYQRNTRELAVFVERDIAARNTEIGRRLDAFKDLLAGDLAFRRGLAEPLADRYMVDLAAQRMPLMGLDVLAICRSDGTILSSGHYRAEFGGNDLDHLHELISAGGQPALIREARPWGAFWALERVDSLAVSGATVYLVGGLEVGVDFLRQLQAGSRSQLVLITTTDTLAATPLGAMPNAAQQRFELPVLSAAPGAKAEFLVLTSRAPLEEILSRLNRNMLWTVSVTVMIAALIGVGLSRQITEPLRALAEQAETITLYPVDLPHRIHSNDEVGQLSQAFRQMIFRLRRERLNLQAAEQQATLVEVARQVNHDIKNGFVPIRNVMRHWERIAQEKPSELARVFEDRKATVLDSLAYLENLARNYARLKPELKLESTDLNHLVAEIQPLFFEIDADIALRCELQPSLPRVSVDVVQMRRVLENLLRNALEALRGRSGEITLRTRSDNGRVTLEVSDTGAGMPEEVRDRILEGFYSTTGGTGLGLLNVRRIVQDFGGRVRIDSVPGRGTTVTLELPVGESAG